MTMHSKNSYKRLILGSAQWGSKYGISNSSGETSKLAVTNILAKASKEGVTSIDTAPAYGDAELKIGSNKVDTFDLITKIPNLAQYPTSSYKLKMLRRSVWKSIQDLNVIGLYGLLFHNCKDLIDDHDGALLTEIRRFKDDGYVKKIGVSVYSGEQIDAVLDVLMPDIIQLPFNLLDQRLAQSGHLKKLKQLGVEIHVRSVFLQGLFHMPIEELPNYFSPIAEKLLDIRLQIDIQNLSINQAALTFVRDQPFIDKILIGVESLSQFNYALKDFVIEPGFKSYDLGIFDENFLNPAKWKLKNGC